MKLTFLLKALNLADCKYHIACSNINLTKGIAFADSSIQSLDPYTLYIGTPQSLTELINRLPLETNNCYTLISSGNSALLSSYFTHKQFNLIITNIPLIQLYNKLNTIYQQIIYTIHKMQTYSLEQKNTEQFLIMLNNSIHGCLFILNNGYKLLHSECSLLYNSSITFSSENDTLSCELLTNQYLSKNTVDLLSSRVQTNKLSDLYLQPIRNHNSVIGYLLILFPTDYNPTIGHILADYSLPYLSKSLTAYHEIYRKIDSLHQFLSDLLARKISNETELRE